MPKNVDLVTAVPIVQLVEHRTHNGEDVGSVPTATSLPFVHFHFCLAYNFCISTKGNKNCSCAFHGLIIWLWQAKSERVQRWARRAGKHHSSRTLLGSPQLLARSHATDIASAQLVMQNLKRMSRLLQLPSLDLSPLRSSICSVLAADV